MRRIKNQRIIEFGDFQTPDELAHEIVNHLKKLRISPATIIEPTCGIGSFILASLKSYSDAEIYGFDINPNYLDLINEKLSQIKGKKTVKLQQADFFELDWPKKIENLTEPVLIIGNPPWVTSSEMTVLDGSNIPIKSNIHGFQGLDAKTGKSNFDISEWMIIELLKALNGHLGTLAMLCKVAVARKVLTYSKKGKITLFSSRIILIDAKEYFGASVDACLFICNVKPESHNYYCHIYENFDSHKPIQEIGYVDEKLIADIPLYNKWKHLRGKDNYVWRSGIKHDCVKVMELKKRGDHLLNGFGEVVIIENEYLHPMLKSSDLANNRVKDIERWMIVTQKAIGEDTSSIKQKAPLTWHYLENNAHLLNKRASSIYHKRPQFSIFGVGSYTFSPWKVAISGFYKELKFRLVGPFDEKPIVFDDTCYFIPAKSFEEASILHTLLDHPFTQEFYHSFIYWDSKRPITKQILQQLDLKKLSNEIGNSALLDLIRERYKNVKSNEITSALMRFY